MLACLYIERTDSMRLHSFIFSHSFCKSREALMAITLESPSPPASLNKERGRSLISATRSSEKRLWSALRSRFDALTENQTSIERSVPAQMRAEAMEQARKMKQDSVLLLRGFDLTFRSLSQLSSNLDTAFQGARDLSRPPTFTELLETTIVKSNTKLKDDKVEQTGDIDKRGSKRKLDSNEDQEGEEEGPYEMGRLKKPKNMTTSMAREELDKVRSELDFMKQRCALLADEIRRRNDNEDDLVRLQLEALMAEKSRLANENANLTRENQHLQQLVEYFSVSSYNNLESGAAMFLHETEDSPLKIPYRLEFS
ncbi:uncharacterized protein LOC127243082 isoform X2 [Andrographis paniculata]|uniref:uncharacterized protein LOC127243082 isoform X2 n=1 Tax=Andrographis paniculata TaxID=175694 RepID=UPI0021E912FB|nr:uncharacterized protein LOC127243082 isoform X2 [Andrographis paniculata]